MIATIIDISGTAPNSTWYDGLSAGCSITSVIIMSSLILTVMGIVVARIILKKYVWDRVDEDGHYTSN